MLAMQLFLPLAAASVPVSFSMHGADWLTGSCISRTAQSAAAETQGGEAGVRALFLDSGKVAPVHAEDLPRAAAGARSPVASMDVCNGEIFHRCVGNGVVFTKDKASLHL